MRGRGFTLVAGGFLCGTMLGQTTIERNSALVVVPVIYTYLDALDRRLRPAQHGAGALTRQPASPHEG